MIENFKTLSFRNQHGVQFTLIQSAEKGNWISAANGMNSCGTANLEHRLRQGDLTVVEPAEFADQINRYYTAQKLSPGPFATITTDFTPAPDLKQVIVEGVAYNVDRFFDSTLPTLVRTVKVSTGNRDKSVLYFRELVGRTVTLVNFTREELMAQAAHDVSSALTVSEDAQAALLSAQQEIERLQIAADKAREEYRVAMAKLQQVSA